MVLCENWVMTNERDVVNCKFDSLIPIIAII